MIRSSSPSIFTSVPDHLPNRMRSPALTSSANQLAGFVAGAGADGDDFAFLRLLLGGVRDDDAALGLSSPSRRRTTTRSCRGRKPIFFSPRVGMRMLQRNLEMIWAVSTHPKRVLTAPSI